MTLEFSSGQDKKINFTTKITLILFAVFVASTIMAVLIQMLETWGIVLGLIVSVGLGYLLMTKSPQKSYRAFVGKALIYSTVIITLIGTVLFLIGKSMLNDVIQVG
jgi:hypothetical protein